MTPMKKPVRQTHRQRIWSIAKKALGVILIIVGLFGIFLPILQGLLLIALGVYLVGNHKLINWLKRKGHEWKRRVTRF